MTTTPKAAETTKDAKPKTVKLDLIRGNGELVATVQRDCRSWTYDVKKIQERFHCARQQALTLIALAQIADEKAMGSKARATSAD